ncbi:MAG TPA: hypothetical protein PLS62_11185 [Desulfobacteraceae bacterium]|nr:hypothetical protein [Desulfobacteraceae bacterium]
MHKPIQKWTPKTLEFHSAGRGRPKKYLSERRQKIEDLLIKTILEIRRDIDFTPGSRGWCYLLEQHGLQKGDFDVCQKIITDARKDGRLPLNICSDDSSRQFHNLERLDTTSVEDEATSWIRWIIDECWKSYNPVSFWRNQKFYVEVIVEKIDLLQLFKATCAKFHVPLASSKGWPDLSLRAGMMSRFKKWEAKGKQCVLLLCGDFDPAGLLISQNYRNMLNEIASAMSWSPEHLIIERFGLNADLIALAGLSWIDNLQTSSGGDLTNPRHPDSKKPYVVEYIKKYGVRKCEANALVTRPDIAKNLIECTLNKYVDENSMHEYQQKIKAVQGELQSEICRFVNIF